MHVICSIMLPELITMKERRKALGITQTGLARRAGGISQSMLAKIENGNETTYSTAKKLFDTLETLEEEVANRREATAGEVMQSPVELLDWNFPLSQAVKLAEKKLISQFPVVREGMVIGGIRTLDMMGEPEDKKVRDFIGDSFPVVNENSKINVVKELLKTHPAVIVNTKGAIDGIITAEDLEKHLLYSQESHSLSDLGLKNPHFKTISKRLKWKEPSNTLQ